MVRISSADVNNYCKIRYNQNITESDNRKRLVQSKEFINELPDDAEAVEELGRWNSRKLSDNEISQIVTDYSENNIGVCELGRKHECHYSTISKILKNRGCR